MELSWKKELILDKALCRTIGVAVFIILTSIGAFVRVPLPFTPVPLTLQTFFALLSGAVLGSSLGALSQVGYLFLGLTGLSVFTGAGSGLWYLAGPTGGYILGFIVASFFLGKVMRSERKGFISILGSFLLADLIILCCGVLWLRCIVGQPLSKLLLIGFLPFIPGDFIKATVAALLYTKIQRRTKEIF